MMKRKQKDRRKSSAYEPKAYFDQAINAVVRKVLPGEYKVTAEPSEVLVTTLGSCVAACIRDPRTGFGGMNHFLLPKCKNTDVWSGTSSALRYGNNAMEVLINEIIRSGCPREKLEIKVFGGSNVIKSQTLIGSGNAKFVLEYLANEGLVVKAHDLGGQYPRRILYSPSTGKVDRLILRRSTDDKKIGQQEAGYQTAMQKSSATTDRPDVEWFDE